MVDPNNPTPQRRLIPRPARLARPNLPPLLRSRIRVPEMALGLGLVAAGTLGSVLWAARGPSERILVAARSIPRGDVLDPSSVRWATVSGDRIVGISDPSELRGRVVIGDVDPGTPLQRALLRPVDEVGPTQAEVGLSLEAGDFPQGLAVGDRVAVVLVSAADPIGGAGTRVVALEQPAVVRSVERLEMAAGSRTNVSVLVPESSVLDIAGATSIRLARLSPVILDGTGRPSGTTGIG
ncbi:MAG: hypothetical protein F2934_08000 [Actinobacteria bacterium]|uniref:Unannotated protein n=1 Tax=freshwater metagenome TaxID=449393 RepID=A0A6J7ECZ0_9ZZZZ|nr:hypothetical protein [Actinomycetota bacterium]MTB07054.1 hypothetical protein [Actinomycetota bacterium]